MMSDNHPHLPRWHCKGVSRERGPLVLTVAAASAGDAKAKLHAQGIVVLKVRRQRNLFQKARSPSGKDITFLCRQLATLLGAGIPLQDAFSLAEQVNLKPPVARLLRQLSHSVAGGLSLADSMRQFPDDFDNTSCALVQTAEATASLAPMLADMATQREKMHRFRAALLKAMAYPLAVLCLALCVTIALLVFAVPEFEAMFVHFHATLPLPTRLVIGISQAFRKGGWLLPLLGGITIFGLITGWKKSVRWQRITEPVLRRVPVWGALIHQQANARFSSLLATALRAGLTLTDALGHMAHATGSHGYTDGIRAIRNRLDAGDTLASAMEKTGLFPASLLNMVQTGEDSSSLEGMLQRASLWMESEVQNRLDTITSLIEPCIMAMLGLLVGGLVIALYLPVLTLGKVI